MGIKQFLNKGILIFKTEIVFAISLILAMITSIITLPKLNYINFQVLILMFNLMVVVTAFEKLKLLDKIAIEILTKHKNLRMVSLILTFLCFFIAIGNLSNMTIIDNFMRKILTTGTNVYFSSILLSQFISNLPCAILLSKFTNSWQEILIGVNIGGTGTIIASLASLISYKFYAKEYDGKKYLFKFTIYNFGSLIIFTLIFYIVLKM